MASITFADCLETAFKSSPEARQALRAWLDGLEQGTAPKQAAKEVKKEPGTDVAANKKDEDVRPALVQYNGKESFHNVRPEDYKWTCVGSHPECQMVVYKRSMPSGSVTMRYYYNSGTVHLQHHVLDLGDGEETCKLRSVSETFRVLTEEKFRKLLDNPPSFYGLGILE